MTRTGGAFGVQAKLAKVLMRDRKMDVIAIVSALIVGTLVHSADAQQLDLSTCEQNGDHYECLTSNGDSVPLTDAEYQMINLASELGATIEFEPPVAGGSSQQPRGLSSADVGMEGERSFLESADAARSATVTRHPALATTEEPTEALAQSTRSSEYSFEGQATLSSSARALLGAERICFAMFRQEYDRGYWGYTEKCANRGENHWYVVGYQRVHPDPSSFDNHQYGSLRTLEELNAIAAETSVRGRGAAQTGSARNRQIVVLTEPRGLRPINEQLEDLYVVRPENPNHDLPSFTGDRRMGSERSVILNNGLLLPFSLFERLLVGPYQAQLGNVQQAQSNSRAYFASVVRSTPRSEWSAGYRACIDAIAIRVLRYDRQQERERCLASYSNQLGGIQASQRQQCERSSERPIEVSSFNPDYEAYSACEQEW